MKFKSFFLSVVMISFFTGTSINADSTELPDQVTFNEHIASIIHKSCSQCHREGQVGPFSLITYRDVLKRSGTIQAVIEDQYMPPWKPIKHQGVEYANDRSLSQYEIDLINKWIESGAKEGDPGKKPAAPSFPEEWYLGKPDLILEMEQGFEVPASGPDINRSFVLKLDSSQLPEDKWVKAIELRPSARGVVHHALFYLDNTGASRKRDGEDGKPGFPEMSLATITGYIGGYVPGSVPTPLPPDLAMSLSKGSDIIMQTHFHPTGKKEFEKSVLGIYFADKPPTKALVGVQVPPFFGRLSGINIPAGEKNYIVKDQVKLPVAVEAIDVGGHAHYICKSMKMTAKLPLPEDRTIVLMEIEDWDLDWQDRYRFKERIPLPKDTIIETVITYDNSDRPENPNSPPKRIRWGKQSSDEMGSITLLVTPVKQDELGDLYTGLKKHFDRMFLSNLKSQNQDPKGTEHLKIFGRKEIFARMVENLDKNKDGKLSREEAPPKLKPQRAFNRFDLDSSGLLEEDELEKLRLFLANL